MNEQFTNTLTKFEDDLKRFSDIKNEDKRNEYDNLLKLSQELVKKIKNIQSESPSENKLPTKDEIESISMMLDVINKIDYTTLDKLNKFGGKSK